MNRFSDFLYWLGHGFSLPRAWNLSADPKAPRTPAWKVYATTLAIGIAAFCAGLSSFF